MASRIAQEMCKASRTITKELNIGIMKVGHNKCEIKPESYKRIEKNYEILSKAKEW